MLNSCYSYSLTLFLYVFKTRRTPYSTTGEKLYTRYMIFVKKFECSGMTSLAFNAIFNLTLLHSFIGVLLEGRRNSKQKRKNV